jgi:hypothetical protein
MGCVQAWSAHGDIWWKNLASISGWLASVGREIYKREREEEMRKQQGGMTRAPSMILHHWWLGEAL